MKKIFLFILMNLYIVAGDYIVETVAGNGNGYANMIDNSIGTSAEFYYPRDLIIKTNKLLVLDTGNNGASGQGSKVREINLTNNNAVSSTIGSGVNGSSDNANPLLATFSRAYFFDEDNSTGDLYINQLSSGKIRKVTSLGVVTTLFTDSDSDYGIAVGDNGKIYVNGYHYPNVKEYNISNGVLLNTYDLSSVGCGSGDRSEGGLTFYNGSIYTACMDKLIKIDLTDSNISTILTASSNVKYITFDSNGVMYYTYNKKIHSYDLSSNTDTLLIDTAIDSTSEPIYGFKVDSNGDIYYTDGDHNGKIYRAYKPIPIKASLKIHGGVLQFKADGYIKRDTPLLTSTDNITMEAWINYQGSTGANQSIIFNGDASNNGYGLYIDTSGNLKALAGGLNEWSGGTLTVSGWNHVAFVISSGTGQIYLNGVNFGSSFAISPNTPSGNFVIGANIDETGYFNGLIDEVRIWNVAKNQTEIFNNMNLQLNGIESGLVAYYNFDESIGDTVVDIVGSNNGVIEGNITRVNFLDTHLNFQAQSSLSDHVDLGDIIENQSKLSHVAWIKLDNYSSEAGAIIAKYHMDYIAISSTGKLFSRFGDGSSYDESTFCNSNINLELNRYYHVAMTMNSDTNQTKLYINGELDKTCNSSFITGDNSSLRAIGAFSPTSSSIFRFKGDIFEVATFSKDLTQNEIKKAMHFGLKGDETDLAGYWKLNEGSGSNIYDRSSNNYHGTITGATWNNRVPTLYGDSIYTQGLSKRDVKLNIENNTSSPSLTTFTNPSNGTLELNSSIYNLSYTPTSLVDDYFTINLNDGVTEQNLTVNVKNRGLYGELDVNGSLNFGLIDTITTKTLTINNLELGTLNLNSIYLTNEFNGTFSLTNNCSSTLSVNSNCSVDITFDPTKSKNGFIATTLQIESNDAFDDNKTVIIYGYGAGNYDISISTYHALIVKKDGTLWSTGKGDYGQLGTGSTTDILSLTQVGSENDWAIVSASSAYFSIALKKDGTLRTWGENTLGQLGNGTNIQQSLPIQIGNYSWLDISTRNSHSLAIKNDGTLWAWGYNANLQLGDGTSIDKNVPTQIGVENNWISVATGVAHSLAIKNDGTLWAWGINNAGRLGLGNEDNQILPVQVGSDSNWIKVVAHDAHSMALKNDGSIWSWGSNSSGQLGTSDTSNRNSPTQTDSNYNWIDIFTGMSTAHAMRSDGTLWGSGSNNFGQLGNGTTTLQTSKVQAGSSSDWLSFTAEGNSVLAVKSDGALWGWGANNYGQLGDGTTTNSSSPIDLNFNLINSVVTLQLQNLSLLDRNITSIKLFGVDGNNEVVEINNSSLIDGENNISSIITNINSNFSLELNITDSNGSVGNWFINFLNGYIYPENNGSSDFKTEINATNNYFTLDTNLSSWKYYKITGNFLENDSNITEFIFRSTIDSTKYFIDTNVSDGNYSFSFEEPNHTIEVVKDGNVTWYYNPVDKTFSETATGNYLVLSTEFTSGLDFNLSNLLFGGAIYIDAILNFSGINDKSVTDIELIDLRVDENISANYTNSTESNLTINHNLGADRYFAIKLTTSDSQTWLYSENKISLLSSVNFNATDFNSTYGYVFSDSINTKTLDLSDSRWEGYITPTPTPVPAPIIVVTPAPATDTAESIISTPIADVTAIDTQNSNIANIEIVTTESGNTVVDYSTATTVVSIDVSDAGVGTALVVVQSSTEKTIETKIVMGEGVTTGIETNGDIKSSIVLDSGVDFNLLSGANGVSFSSGERVTVSIPVGVDISIGKDGLTTSFPTTEGDVKTTITSTGEIKVVVVTTTGESVNFNSSIASKTEVDSSGSIRQSFNLTDMVADLIATKRAEVKGKFIPKGAKNPIEINVPKGSEVSVTKAGVNAVTKDSNYNSNMSITKDGVVVNVEPITRANERNVTYSSRRDASNIKVEVLFPKKSRFRRVERGQVRSNYSYRREISKTLTQNRSSESNLTITPNGKASFEENLYFDGSENLNLKSGNVLVNGSIGDSEFNLDGAEKFNLNDNGTFEASKSSENSTGSLKSDSNGELRVDFYSENNLRARLSKNRVSYSPRRDVSNIKVDFLFDESNQRRVGSDRAEVKYSARRAFSFSKERATDSFTITPISEDVTFKEYVYSSGEYQIELLTGEATITVDNNSSNMVLNQIYDLPNLEVVEDRTYQSGTLSHTLDIEKGWNLLASPVESDITDFFIFGDFDKIWLYDENIWSKNPDTIPYYRGFWIKANDNSSIEFSGESYLKNLETLQEGWSLISLGDTVEDNISNSTYKIEDIFVYRDNSFKKLKSINELNYAEATWIKKREATESLTLNQGWNLVSVPVVKNIDDFSIFSDYKSIKVYREDSWIANPDSIIPTEGFWIDMEEALEIPFYGAKFEADLTDVYNEKWHLKGGYIEDISKYSFEFWIYRNQKWLSNKLNNLKEIKAGEGFWVK